MLKIIEIKALDNGAHRNQVLDNISIPDTDLNNISNIVSIPEGWAVIPDDKELENFPFGEIEAREIDGVMTVTKWTAGIIPEVKETEKPVSELEQLRADTDYIAVMMGVEL